MHAISSRKRKGRREEVPAFSYVAPAGGGAGGISRETEGGGTAPRVVPVAENQATLSSLIVFSKTSFSGLATSSAALVLAAWKSLT